MHMRRSQLCKSHAFKGTSENHPAGAGTETTDRGRRAGRTDFANLTITAVEESFLDEDDLKEKYKNFLSLVQ